MKAPALSDRTHRIEPFHTMELMKRAVALQQAGHPVIHMSIGEPDFKAPEPRRCRWPAAHWSTRAIRCC